MKKTVLITGANGLLGQKLIDLYLTKTDKIVVGSGVGPCRHPLKDHFKYIELDITDEAQVQFKLSEFHIDTVINTAAMTNVDICETDHEGCDKLNISAVRYLVNACNSINAHLIHLSTDFIFDGQHGPLTEKEEPNPLSYYGWSKLKGEQEIINFLSNELRTNIKNNLNNNTEQKEILEADKKVEENNNQIIKNTIKINDICNINSIIVYFFVKISLIRLIIYIFYKYN